MLEFLKKGVFSGTDEFLDNQELEIESYDEDLVRKLVDKVVVYDEELKIVLKSGVEVNVYV